MPGLATRRQTGKLGIPAQGRRGPIRLEVISLISSACEVRRSVRWVIELAQRRGKFSRVTRVMTKRSRILYRLELPNQPEADQGLVGEALAAGGERLDAAGFDHILA